MASSQGISHQEEFEKYQNGRKRDSYTKKKEKVIRGAYKHVHFETNNNINKQIEKMEHEHAFKEDLRFVQKAGELQSATRKPSMEFTKFDLGYRGSSDSDEKAVMEENNLTPQIMNNFKANRFIEINKISGTKTLN